MNVTLHRWLIILLFLLVSGCAGWRTGQVPRLGSEEKTWLARLDHWQLQGRVGVTGGQGSWHGQLRWRHHNDFDQLLLSGPFGQGGATVSMGKNWIRIERSDGQVQVSSRPEELLQTLLGVKIPWQKLKFWILGKAAPSSIENLEYTSEGRLKVLSQAGWLILYERYVALGQTRALPEKIILKSPEEIVVKLIVSHWKIDG